MNVFYRKAKQKDIDTLIDVRIKLIEEASGALTEPEKKELYKSSKEHIKNNMKNGDYFAYLAFDSDVFVGTCSVNLYSVLPGKKLPKGKRAYLQNVYVVPEYRRQGIAHKLVSLSIEEARQRGHARIELHASQNGAPLFEKLGFKNDISTLSYMVNN